MITVPRKVVPEVQSRAIPNVTQRIETPDGMFGDGGRGLAKAADAFDRLGANLDKRATTMLEEQNSARTLELTNMARKEAMDKLYNPESGILTKKGGNALGAQAEMEKTMSELRQKYGQIDGDNQVVKDMMAKNLSSLEESTVGMAQRHQFGEFQSYKSEQLAAIQETNVRDVSLNFLDQNNFQKKLVENLKALEAQANQEGWGREKGGKYDLEKQNLVSKLRGGQIDGMIETNTPANILLANSVFKEALAQGQITDPVVVSRIREKLQVAVPQAVAHTRYSEMKTQRGTEHIRQAAVIAGQNGIDPEYAAKVAWIESRGVADAKNPNSTAGGLYQFTDGTAKRYGLINKYDASASSQAFVAMTKNNIEYLSKQLGRAPSNAELYMAHQQGEGGAAKLLKNPMRLAINIVGRDAVINNGGKEDMTAAEFTALWQKKYESETVPYSQDFTPPQEEIMRVADESEKEYAGSGKEIIELFNKDVKARDAIKSARKEELQDIISQSNQENNGDWTLIPASLRADAAAHGIDVTAFKGVSDPDVKNELDAMPTSQFFSLNLNDTKYAQGLTYSDRQEYIKKQKDYSKPENKFMGEMVDGVVGYYFRVNKESDPDATGNKSKVAAMKNYVMFKSQELIQKGKTPTKQDITQFASEYLPLIEKSQADTVEDIDENTRQIIESQLKSIGVEPTESSIMALYLNLKDIKAGKL